MSDERIVPAAAASSSRAFAMGLEELQIAGGRVWRLHRDDGQALLVLEPPDGENDDGSPSGPAHLVAASVAEGEALLLPIARFLGATETEQPRARVPLAPAPLRWTELGDGVDPEGRSWRALRLGFAEGEEIFARVSPSRDEAQLLERDSRARARLVTRFASALRDGVPDDGGPPLPKSRRLYLFRGRPTTLDLAAWATRAPSLLRYRSDLARTMSAAETLQAAERLLRQKLDAAGAARLARWGRFLDETLTGLGDGADERFAALERIATTLAFVPRITLRLATGLGPIGVSDYRARLASVETRDFEHLFEDLRDGVAEAYARDLSDERGLPRRIEELLATASRTV